MRRLVYLLVFVLILTGCTFSTDDENKSLVETPTLVTGENLATNVENKTEVKIETMEDLLEVTIDFALTSTICVKNYQTIITKVVGGSFFRPTYEEKEEHGLYGTGSGVIYYKALTVEGSYLYKVITNEHVVSVDSSVNVKAGEEEYKIYDEAYDEEITAKLIGKDSEADIAVLEFVSKREYNAVTFAKKEDIKVGNYVIAVGTPIDIEFYNTCTYGIVSRIKETYIQHDAAINSGNSGGPLFNIYGKLIGINNSKLSGSTSTGVSIEGIYFAIPIDVVAETVKEITGLDEIIYA